MICFLFLRIKFFNICKQSWHVMFIIFPQFSPLSADINVKPLCTSSVDFGEQAFDEWHRNTLGVF